MSADFAMRLRLQQVAAYQELCRNVRRSGWHNVLFAALMLFVTYANHERGADPVYVYLLGGLAVGELLVGLYKWLAPSAEGVLLDGLVLLVFVAFNLWQQFARFRQGMPPSPVIILFSLFMLMNAAGQFQAYGRLRRLFAERPAAEHMAWFDDLSREVREADPEADELALDLPTTPHWKAKLFGTTAVFVARRGADVWVAGPEDFELLREKADRGTGRRKARLSVYGVEYPEFELADTTWENYRRWRTAFPAAPVA